VKDFISVPVRLYQRADTTVLFIVLAHLKDKIPEETNYVKVTEDSPVLAVKPYEGLLVCTSPKDTLPKALALRETITSENGAVLYPTLIGTEEYPTAQAASLVLVIEPLVLLTITFKYGKALYLVPVAVKVTQYQEVAVADAVPKAAQTLTSPYLALNLAGAVTKVVPTIVKSVLLLNLASALAGIIHNPAV